jgi:hypothetical protein
VVPVVVQYTTDVGPEEYDEIVSSLRFHDDLPAGLIMHTAAVTENGGMKIFDVWHSREAHDRFAESRLRPAIVAVVGSERAGGTGPEIHQVHSLVRPVGS